MKIIELETVDSTNEYLKNHDSGEDMIVTAKRQTGGKGTKGRSFSSEEGGLYISVMRHRYGLAAENAFTVMINACVAVCKTLEQFGIKPVIRWANDVLADGKKICGTLIENTFSGGYIRRSVVGIGINVNNDLPSELRDIATSVKLVTGKEIPVDSVAGVLIANLEKEYSITDYKSYINWLNCEITVKTDGGSFTALALDIEEDGRLKVEREGNILKLSAAEVSLRL